MSTNNESNKIIYTIMYILIKISNLNVLNFLLLEIKIKVVEWIEHYEIS